MIRLLFFAFARLPNLKKTYKNVYISFYISNTVDGNLLELINAIKMDQN